jgi:hypothetical protein
MRESDRLGTAKLPFSDRLNVEGDPTFQSRSGWPAFSPKSSEFVHRLKPPLTITFNRHASVDVDVGEFSVPRALLQRCLGHLPRETSSSR